MNKLPAALVAIVFVFLLVIGVVLAFTLQTQQQPTYQSPAPTYTPPAQQSTQQKPTYNPPTQQQPSYKPPVQQQPAYSPPPVYNPPAPTYSPPPVYNPQSDELQRQQEVLRQEQLRQQQELQRLQDAQKRQMRENYLALAQQYLDMATAAEAQAAAIDYANRGTNWTNRIDNPYWDLASQYRAKYRYYILEASKYG